MLEREKVTVPPRDGGVIGSRKGSDDRAGGDWRDEYGSPVERLAQAIHFRRSFGLRHDEAYVRALLADPALSERAWVRNGTPVTDEEQRQIDEEQAWADQTYKTIARYAREHAANVFAGITSNWTGRGLELSVGVTADVERHLAWIRSLCEHPERIDAFAARFTQRELEAVAEEVSRDWEQLEREGLELSWISVNVARNCVEIGIVETLSASDRARLHNRYSHTICITEHAGIVLAAAAPPC